MSAIVLDASVVIAWLMKEPGVSAAVDKLLERVATDGAAAPRLLLLEAPNGLRTRLRRGQISSAQRDLMLDDFLRLPFDWDDESDPRALVQISDQSGLTLYDAAYLEVAVRRRLPLATLDQRLAEAARASGVSSAL